MGTLGRIAAAITIMSTPILVGTAMSGPLASASPVDADSQAILATTAERNDGTDGAYAPKRLPSTYAKAGASTRAAAHARPEFFRYAGAHQRGVRVDGARGYYTIERPRVAPADYHSLGEISVADATEDQIVEIGWTVDRAVFGDDDPHLFVYHWVDGEETCYNGCGFVPGNDPTYRVGMKLPTSTTPVQFSIVHRGSEWLLGYNGHWVGSFPDTLWGNRFKVGAVVQWFGEVSSSTPTPCTDMGNGRFGASASAARVQDIGFWPGQVSPNIQINATTPALYTAVKTGPASFRYGGTGDCRTVPNLIGALPSNANRAITASGLVVGTVGTVVDPLCEDIGRVLSRSPSAGTTLVPGGSSVNYRYGVEPRGGCPTAPQ